MYLPEKWATDPKRREAAKIPAEVEFQEKWRIALSLLDQALGWGLSARPVVGDAGFGDVSELRAQLESRNLKYVLGVSGTAVAWPPGVMPLAPEPRRAGTPGRPRTKWRDGDARVVPLSQLASELPRTAWRKITWREGSRGPQSSRFAAIRIRTAHRHAMGDPPSDPLWLLCEWPRRQSQPSKLYLSNLPASAPLKHLVYLAKLRWRIERDYQEMKSELGLDHFEGRGWLGFHHHVACVALAHAFLTLQRALFPPVPREAHFPGISESSSTRATEVPRLLPSVLPNLRAKRPTKALTHVIE